MHSVKLFLSTIFSLRTIVVVAAVLLLLLNHQYDILEWVDQTLFLTAQAIASPEQSFSLLPLELKQRGWLSQQLMEHNLYLPSHFQWLELLLVSSVASFLVIVIPRLNFATGMLLVGCLLASLIVTQLFQQVFRQQWYPFGITIQFLLVGYGLMLFWLLPHRQIQSLSVELQNTKVRLSRVLAQQGQFKDADDLLATCSLSREALDATYDIALQYERKRQYDQAISVYERIVEAKRGYKDAASRLNELRKFDNSANQALGAADVASTLVLPDKQVGKPILGRYEIERELGRGAMGVVYLGRDPKISRTVAIKTLSYSQFDHHLLSELKERFFREAEAAGRLSHPSIVTVYDVGEEPDLAFIAMDYAEGKPLSHYCKVGSLLPLDRVHKVILKVAEALEYAHQKNIVHRDIKPGNIIYNPSNGDVKVTDFGIAKIVDDSKTKTGSVMGSPLYMSPEQLMGKKVTGSSDVYSLGATFYQLLTGTPPFDGDSLATLTYKIINQKHPAIKSLRADIPAATTRIINKALQKDPEKRFGTAEAMAQTLQKVIDKEFNREVVR
ncbi:serine/threonine protein kinase [Alkalimarinus sediminis]|uniref:non-specific serine/threonine protein kinase n=1 Tax=Alkalimarinus sediminis TaxID=1632866 RepID=A0A9E8HNK2_9ALTE|nr:serine/threonine-protein kinase [Alkalimarinus sediminis]UZW73586.1 serine/threonine protein kinase [Alkalimarinus sediminis]